MFVTALAIAGLSAHAAEKVIVSPDVTLVLAGETLDDETVASDDSGGTVAPIGLGLIPTDADVVAYHRRGGDHFFAVDVPVVLPGGLRINPRDAAESDGASFEILFKGDAAGLPLGVGVDALTVQGSDLWLSFDSTVVLDGLTVADEDLVAFDGVGFAMAFDGSAANVTSALDLDGAHLFDNGDLALSFDGSGVLGGVDFDDEDVLVIDSSGDWSLLYNGSGLHASWQPGDLDALYIDEQQAGPLFSDGFESGNTSGWSTTVQ